MKLQPWYADGLRFKCTQCGNCCGGASGTVFVTDIEIERLANRLELTVDQFLAVFTRRHGKDKITLREKADFDCIFYDKKSGCTVYEDRPKQCRTWPFWSAIVVSEESWAQEAKHCPGMNHGPTYNASFIRRTSENDGSSGKPKP